MRKKYTNEEIDVTFIEIRPNEDQIINFMELDEDININIDVLEKTYKKKYIYILHYPKGKLSVSYGLINSLIDGKKIEHCCDTEIGSSGSPIVSLETYKIIGIHYGGNNRRNFGTFIKFAMEEFKKHEKEKNFGYILDFPYGRNLPDIKNFAIEREKKIEVHNNIIYYAEYDVNNIGRIKKDSDYFERITPGAFILCTSIDSLQIIKLEILKQFIKDKNTTFNLITSGNLCEKIMNYLKENEGFKNCIKNICIYSLDLQKWYTLKNKYKIIYDIYDTRKGIVDFINKFASKEIKPFPLLSKPLTYEDYLDKYKDRHLTISQFYGDLNLETYKCNIEALKKLIKTESDTKELLNKDMDHLLSGFLTFNLSDDLERLDKLIIREYTRNTIYKDLNKWLINPKINFYKPVAYFTARLMYSLNQYASKNSKYVKNEEFYGGATMPYSNLLPYERAKGKIIFFPSFSSTIYGDIITESERVAKKYSGLNDSLKLYETQLRFSVTFIIKNNYKNTWISNGIKISDLSQYKSEKQIMYHPFSFYYVRNVLIDIKNYIADIYLETIGKKEILEEKIKCGKEIEYNEKEGIMQIKK